MLTYELRDGEEARRFLFQGLWLQRVLDPSAGTVRPALQWALEVASEGIALPPLGFVADLGHAALGMDWEGRSHRPTLVFHHLPPTLMPTYEDHVLGKLYADWSFIEASEALRQYPEGRDQARGLAYLLRQFRERAGFPGVELAPGIIASALELSADEVLRLGFETLEKDGVDPLLVTLYEGLIAATRRLGDVLSRGDVFELKHRMALDEEGERLALRQVLLTIEKLEETLPRHRIRPLARRQEVPTRVLDEDTYPVGGFSSISTRGSIESLLHSQLAYMEPEGERPDLFDIKFLRDELLFYSRDENQFLRRRRTFVLALFPDLIDRIHFKDPGLPYQRGILLLAVLALVVRKLAEWLNTDALVFEVVCFAPARQGAAQPLAAEQELLEKVLREQVLNNTVKFTTLNKVADLKGHCELRARKSLCHCLAVSTQPRELSPEWTVVTQLQVDGPMPAVGPGGEAPTIPEGDDAFDTWAAAMQQILQRWI